MTHIDTSKYSRETLEHLLRIVKSYRTSLKQIGKRALLIDPANPPAITTLVEYMPGMKQEDIEKCAEKILHARFPGTSLSSMVLKENPKVQ